MQRPPPTLKSFQEMYIRFAEGRGWVVVRPARLSVVTAVAVNAEMGPASRVRRIGGLVSAEALTAAGSVQPDGEPGGLACCTE